MLSPCFWECFPSMRGADARGSIKNSVFFINLYSDMESSYSREVDFYMGNIALVALFLLEF